MVSSSEFLESGVIESKLFGCISNTLTIVVTQSAYFSVCFWCSDRIFGYFCTIIVPLFPILTDSSGPEEVVCTCSTACEGLICSLWAFVKKENHIVSRHPERCVDLQSFKQEIRRASGNIGRNEAFYGYGFDLPFQVGFCFGSPRSVTSQHFIEDDSDGPDIALWAVLVVIKSFKRHVDGGAYIVIGVFPDIWVADGKAEIGNLDFPFIEENVGRFKISVNNAETVDSPISVDDFFEDGDWLSFGDGLSGFNHFGEVSPVAEFSNDAGMEFEGDDLVEFDDVLEVAEKSEDFHLVIKEGFVDISLDIFHVDEFEGDGLALVMGMVPLV